MALPAWALISLIGANMAGKGFQSVGQGKQTDKMLRQRNKEFIAGLNLKNKQLTQQDDQFRQMQKMKQKSMTENAPSNIMDTISMITNLGRQPATTADTLKYLTSQ